ncbi:MAG: hypothetical protein OSP8Acid_03260 [uncultured Acidilobus sp. OSP8]|nr:MAG: hypothetical protein OSP8Acid_03260 [uncultured Acidilobus sp. OSP8]
MTTEGLRALKRLRAAYCSDDPEVCKTFLSLINETGRLIAKARLEDLSSKDYTGVDSGFLKAFERLRDLYAAYLSASLISRGEKVLLVATADLLTPDGYLVRAGEAWMADVGLAAPLYALGLVRPVLTWPEELNAALKVFNDVDQKRL